MPHNIGTTSFEVAASGGDLTTNSYTMHADMSYLVEYINVTSALTAHPGEGAYPSQVA